MSRLIAKSGRARLKLLRSLKVVCVWGKKRKKKWTEVMNQVDKFLAL